VSNNIYLALSYASLAIKYWCAHFATLQPQTRLRPALQTRNMSTRCKILQK